MDETVDLLKIKIEEANRKLPLETINAINAVDWRMAILGLRAKKGYSFEQLGDLELETELLLAGLVSPENYPKELQKRMGISPGAANELVNEMNDSVFKKIREEMVKNTERKKIFARNSNNENIPPLPARPAGGLNNKEENEGRFLNSNSPHPNPLLVKERGDTNDAQILRKEGIEIIDKEPLLEITGATASGNKEDTLKRIEAPEISTSNGVHPILEQKLSGSVQIPTVKTEHSLENITKKYDLVVGAPSGAVKPKIDPYREIPE